MSSSSLSLTKAKEITIKFIKKYKDSLRHNYKNKRVSNDDIACYEKMTPREFFDNIDISAAFGMCFDVFNIGVHGNSTRAEVWMCEHSNINNLKKTIDNSWGTRQTLCECWEMGGMWRQMTEARMKVLETIFDRLCTKSKASTAKKSSKKQAKKVVKKQNTIEISDAVTIEQDIAFIDTANDKFDHLMNIGGENVNITIDNTNDLDASNQIDHVINAFKLAKKELDVFIGELVKAKEHGAKNVVDSFWCPIKEFKFH